MSVFSSIECYKTGFKRRATIVEGGHTKFASMFTKILSVLWWVTGELYFVDTDGLKTRKYCMSYLINTKRKNNLL